MRLFSEKVKPTFTSSNLNILTIESFEEVFFDVYELEINGNKFIAEKKSQYKGSPVVDIPVVIGSKEYSAPFVLREGKFEVLFNEENTTFVGSSEVTEEDLSVFEQEEVVEDIVLEKRDDILEDVRSARLSAKKYAEKIKETKLQEAVDEIKIKNDFIKSEVDTIKNNLVNEFYTETVNAKEELSAYNEKKEVELTDFVKLIVKDKLKSLQDKITTTSDLTKANLTKDVEQLAESLKLTLNSNQENLSKSVVSLVREEFNKVVKVVDHAIDKKSKILDTKLYGQVQRQRNELLALEKANIELNDNINKANSKALSRIGNVKKELEDSLLQAETRVKDFYGARIKSIEEGIFEGSKEEILKIVRESRESILEEIINVKTDIPAIAEARSNVDTIKKDIEKSVSEKFTNEMQSIKRLIEMSSGGGSVAVQYADGGTMNGDLNVVGNILSGGTNLNDIFGSGGTVGPGTLNYIPKFDTTTTVGDSIAFQETSHGELTTQLSIAGDLSAAGTLSASDAKFGSDSIRINGPAGTIYASGSICTNSCIESWSGTSCFGGTALDVCAATPLNACGCVRVGTAGSHETPLTVTGNISANGSILGTSLSGTNINASSTTRGIVSAGRDIADIFTLNEGNITGVTAGCGLFGGGSSGDVTLGIGAGTGITIGVSSVAVDSTVVRTCGDQTITGCKTFVDNTTIQGNLSVTGDITCIDTIVSTTSALSVVNAGTGPALFVRQDGTEPIAHFVDKNGDDIVFADDGYLGIGTYTPSEKLTVAGNISAHGGICTTHASCCNYFAGCVGIGTTSPGEALTVSGNISANGSILGTSLSGNSIEVSCTNRGIVSAGRDLADIFATSSGNVDGSGTACYLPVWSDSDTIGNSIACQSASLLTVAGNISASGGLSAVDLILQPEGIIRNTVGASRSYIQFWDWSTDFRYNTCSILQLSNNVVFNNNGQDVDFKISSVPGKAFFVEGSSGKIGMGTTSPNEKLTVSGNISAQGSLSAAGPDNNYFAGNVGIGTTSPSEALTVSGNISASGSVYSTNVNSITDRVNGLYSYLIQNFDSNTVTVATNISDFVDNYSKAGLSTGDVITLSATNQAYLLGNSDGSSINDWYEVNLKPNFIFYKTGLDAYSVLDTLPLSGANSAKYNIQVEDKVDDAIFYGEINVISDGIIAVVSEYGLNHTTVFPFVEFGATIVNGTHIALSAIPLEGKTMNSFVFKGNRSNLFG